MRSWPDDERWELIEGEAFAMTVKGKRYAERKEAGRSLLKEILTLMQLQQEGETAIASIGGFDLEYCGERFGRDAALVALAVASTALTSPQLTAAQLTQTLRSVTDPIVIIDGPFPASMTGLK